MPKHNEDFKTEGNKTQEVFEYTSIEELAREGIMSPEKSTQRTDSLRWDPPKNK